jgi:hypothetical protein
MRLITRWSPGCGVARFASFPAPTASRCPSAPGATLIAGPAFSGAPTGLPLSASRSLLQTQSLQDQAGLVAVYKAGNKALMAYNADIDACEPIFSKEVDANIFARLAQPVRAD